MPDFAAINEALYARAATDSDGAAVRALVGSVFPAAGLARLSGKTLPYLVYQFLPADGSSDTLINVNAGWYAYVAPGSDVTDLLTIASAVYTLFGAGAYRRRIAGGRLTCLAPRQPFYDSKLSLDGIHIPFYFRTGG